MRCSRSAWPESTRQSAARATRSRSIGPSFGSDKLIDGRRQVVLDGGAGQQVLRGRRPILQPEEDHAAPARRERDALRLADPLQFGECLPVALPGPVPSARRPTLGSPWTISLMDRPPIRRRGAAASGGSMAGSAGSSGGREWMSLSTGSASRRTVASERAAARNRAVARFRWRDRNSAFSCEHPFSSASYRHRVPCWLSK